jgi:hypothetical protein
VVCADGSPCSPGSASKFADPFSVLHIALISEKSSRPSSVRDRKDTGHLSTGDLQDEHRPCQALDGLGDLDAADDALAIGAGQADGVADQRPQPQRLDDMDIGQVRGGAGRRIDPRCDQVRFVGLDRQLARGLGVRVRSLALTAQQIVAAMPD